MNRSFVLERRRDEANHSWGYAISELDSYHSSGSEEKLVFRAFYVDGVFALMRSGVNSPFGIAKNKYEADNRLYDSIVNEFKRMIKYNGDTLEDRTERDIQHAILASA